MKHLPHDGPNQRRDASSSHNNVAAARLRHLNQIDLARRWRISARTLERWRWLKRGPRYIKLGGRVLYRLADVEDFERESERTTGESPAEDD